MQLEARLQQVAEWQRSFETASVALLRDFALPCDERGVREEVVGEVLGAEIVVSACQIEELTGECLGALDVAEGDQHLADADKSPHLATTITEGTVRNKALVEGFERARFVVRRVDQQPAELVESIRSLAVVGQPVPGRDGVVEMSSAASYVAYSRQELAGGCEGACTCPLVGDRGAEDRLEPAGTFREVRMRKLVPESDRR